MGLGETLLVGVYPEGIIKLKKLDELIQNILKEKDLIRAIKQNLMECIEIIAPYLKKYNVINVSSKKVKEIIEELEKIEDELLREMILAIAYLDYWKVKYYEEEGPSKFLEKVLENFDAISKEVELFLWIILYLKDKERVMRYKNYLKKLIEELEDKTLEFIPEEEISGKEEKELRELLKELDKEELVEWKEIMKNIE